MNILSKLWSCINYIWVAINKEPTNSVLDVSIPSDENNTDSNNINETDENR